jgi:hypothetical protein
MKLLVCVNARLGLSGEERLCVSTHMHMLSSNPGRPGHGQFIAFRLAGWIRLETVLEVARLLHNMWRRHRNLPIDR